MLWDMSSVFEFRSWSEKRYEPNSNTLVPYGSAKVVEGGLRVSEQSAARSLRDKISRWAYASHSTEGLTQDPKRRRDRSGPPN